MKADVLALVQMLGNNQPDGTTISALYDEIVNEWGARNFFISNATLIATTQANTEFTLPDPIRNVGGVVWDDTILSNLTLRELEALNPEWRTESGTPTAFTAETETAKVLALYPSPFGASSSPGATPDPLGVGYPTYNAVVFHSEFRVDVPSYWELILALYILEREFIRESDHKDEVFAQYCGILAQTMEKMVA